MSPSLVRQGSRGRQGYIRSHASTEGLRDFHTGNSKRLRAMLRKFGRVLRFLYTFIVRQDRSAHSRASEVLAIPPSWRNADELRQYGDGRLGISEPDRLTDLQFLHKVRRAVGADVVLRVGLRRRVHKKTVLRVAVQEQAPESNPQKALSEFLAWPASELRRAVRYGASAGRSHIYQSALIKFPSELFGHLPHSFIHGAVLVTVDRKPTGNRSLGDQFVVFLNGGTRELGDLSPTLRTQHERLGFQVLCAELECAETIGARAQTNNPNDSSMAPTVGATERVVKLQRQAWAANSTFERLPKDWGREICRAILEEFSGQVKAYLGADRAIGELRSAKKTLLSRRLWLEQNRGWFSELLHDPSEITFIDRLLVLVSLLHSLCTEREPASPTTLERVVYQARVIGEEGLRLPEGVTAEIARKHLLSETTVQYQEEIVEARIDDVQGHQVTVTVFDKSNCGVAFRGSLPVEAVQGEPSPGDRYTLTVWDLWHHWFGVLKGSKIRSFAKSWAREGWSRYVARLEKDLAASTDGDL